MNRSLAALAAGAMLLASAPTLGLAEESSSASSASSSSVSSSSSSVSSASSSASSVTSSSSSFDGPSWMVPCKDLTGLKKAQCIVKHNPGKGNKKKDRVERRNDDKVLRLSADCQDKEGSEKAECIRKHGKHGIKNEIRPPLKRVLKRTIRGKMQEIRTSSASSQD